MGSRSKTTVLFAVLAIVGWTITVGVPGTAAADRRCGSDYVADRLASLAYGQHRSADHVARNRYRHPVETLSWFGFRDHMTVVEISPGGAGWYTEILGPFLKDCGRYYAASYDPESEVEYQRRNAARFREKVDASPDYFGEVKVTVLAPPEKLNIAPAGSADMVVTFRNTHGWVNDGVAGEVFAAMYRVLKPGGTLGLVQHRGDPNGPQDPRAGSGYLRQDVVIAIAEAAGFEFVDSTEINANPADDRDHPEGVWTLPPRLRLEDTDRDKYLAIGESDRMTLKFRKP